MWTDFSQFLTAMLGSYGLPVFWILLGFGAFYVFFIKQSSASFDKYYEYKLSKCADAALTVAQIANSDDEETLKRALRRFDELYYGELVLFEGTRLEGQMVKLRQMLLGAQDRAELQKTGLNNSINYEKARAKRDEGTESRAMFRQAALELSVACRYEMTPTIIGAMLDLLNPFHRKYK
jgi:hypothetical protein